jgi:hypothetical protein
MERFVKGESSDLEKPLEKHFLDDLQHLRERYQENLVLIEREWGFTREFESTGWNSPNTWLRIKADAIELHEAGAMTLIDLKSGKKYGNEVKHNQQGQLYAIGAFLEFPEVDLINVQFWYCDQQGKKTKKDYPRSWLPKAMGIWQKKGLKVTEATDFPPKPNVLNCKFCDFGTVNGTGICQYAVEPL